MKAFRENVQQAHAVISIFVEMHSRLKDTGAVATLTKLSEFVADCGNWLPPERDYNRAMEHETKNREKIQKERGMPTGKPLTEVLFPARDEDEMECPKCYGQGSLVDTNQPCKKCLGAGVINKEKP